MNIVFWGFGIILSTIIIWSIILGIFYNKPVKKRKYLEYFLIALLLALNCKAQDIDLQKYKYTIAEFESRHNYKAYNKSGASGKYQMIYRYIPNRYNCGSKKSFLLNPKAQELAMDNQIKETLAKSKKEAKKLGVHVFYLLAYYHWQGNYASLKNFKYCYKELNKRYIFYKAICKKENK